MKRYDWSTNAFYNDVSSRLARLNEQVNYAAMRWDEKAGAWSQKSVPDKCSMVAFLQNRHMCWDVTDHGVGIAPMIYDTRSYFAISAEIHDGQETTDLRDLLEAGNAVTRYFPGGVEILYHWDGNSVSFFITLPHGEPCAYLTMDAHLLSKSATIVPYLLAYPTSVKEAHQQLSIALRHFPIFDEVVSRNNSITADPLRKENEKSRLHIAWMDYAGELTPVTAKLLTASVLLCDRTLDTVGLSKMILGTCNPGKYTLKLAQQGDKAEVLRPKPFTMDYWNKILSKGFFDCPLPELNRQFRYSLHNSLFSRAEYSPGETIFIHGRPDRGYGDCGKLHQSYQMYYPALLVGEYESVKSELRAYAAWMDANGSVSFQLSVGGGRHHYDGLYSNAHYIMGVYRYLCFSGDIDFLSEMIFNQNIASGFTVLDSLLLAGEWLLKRRTSQGVMMPCGAGCLASTSCRTSTG